MLVDALAKAEGVELNRLQENAAVARAIINKNKVVLAKPMTFMNNSGESVGKLSRFYKVITVLLSLSQPLSSLSAVARQSVFQSCGL